MTLIPFQVFGVGETAPSTLSNEIMIFVHVALDI